LVAIDVSEFPCQAAVCNFPADLMNKVMMGLFWSVVDVLKDCDKAGLAVTTNFNGVVRDVMGCGDGFCDDNDGKDAAEFAAVWVDIVGVSWGNMCSEDARGLTIPILQDKGSSVKIIFVRAVAHCYGVPSYDGLGNSTTVIRTVESAYCPFIVVVD
jgi:hypothetical protein